LERNVNEYAYFVQVFISNNFAKDVFVDSFFFLYVLAFIIIVPVTT